MSNNPVRPRPPKAPRKAPAYCQRKEYDQAIVTHTEADTGKRRDYWLGAFGSPEHLRPSELEDDRRETSLIFHARLIEREKREIAEW